MKEKKGPLEKRRALRNSEGKSLQHQAQDNGRSAKRKAGENFSPGDVKTENEEKGKGRAGAMKTAVEGQIMTGADAGF